MTQSPTDVPDDVLAQLGSRVQHQLRAHTPNDAKALRATVNTYPTSEYDDLGQVITSLGIGEAVVTVMNERGAPTPVAWTMLRAPESSMRPADQGLLDRIVADSPLSEKYAEPLDRDCAREMLARKLEAGAAAEAGEVARRESQMSYPKKSAPSRSRSRKQPPQGQDSAVHDILSSPVAEDLARTAAREIFRGVFGTARRR